MPTLSRRTLLELRALVAAVDTREGGRSELLLTIETALKPKRSLAPARKRREAKKKTHREEIGAIREAVLQRAKGVCEACNNTCGDLEVDHFFGGSRRRSLQSETTCWALCPGCHREKTRNVPNASHWLTIFTIHASGYRYERAATLARQRNDALRIQGRAG